MIYHNSNPKPGKKKKKKREQDLKYRDFIRSQGCLTCGYPVTYHHHESLSGSAMGSKCPDRESLPLCLICHGERHTQGRYTFYAMYGIDYKKEVLKYQLMYKEAT